MVRGRFGSLKVLSAFLLTGALFTGAAAAAYAQAVQTANIVERNFAIEGAPTSVRAGQQIRFNVTNPGPTGQHNLNIDGNGIPTIAAAGDNVQPNTTGVLTITAPSAPGTYKLFCPVGQHRANGMEVNLTVVAGAAALPATGGGSSLPIVPLGLAGAGLLSGAAGILLRRRAS